MMEKKPLTVKELIEILKKVDPNALIASVDYNGVDFFLCEPNVRYIEKGEIFNLTDVDKGGKFVNKQNRFVKNTVYIGN